MIVNKLCDLHNDYSLAAGKKVMKEMSECQFQIIGDNKFSLGKNEKLISNLDKKKTLKFIRKILFRVMIRSKHNSKSNTVIQ